MKVSLLLWVGFVQFINSFAQDSIRVYLDNDFLNTTEDKATIIRTAVIRDNHYCITDQFIDGKMINYGEYSSINPFIEDGLSRHYDNEGNLYSSGNYKNGRLKGKWTYYTTNSADTVEYLAITKTLILECDSTIFNNTPLLNDTSLSSIISNSIENFLINNFHMPARDRYSEQNDPLLINLILNQEGKIKCIHTDCKYKDTKDELNRILSKFQYNRSIDTVIQLSINYNVKDPDNKTEEGNWFVDENATFQGGDLNKFSSWIAMNIQYPAAAALANITGKVIVQFAIDKYGNTCDISVIRSAHPVLDTEAIRIIMNSPKWNPGLIGKTPVKQIFVIPIVFSVH